MKCPSHRSLSATDHGTSRHPGRQQCLTPTVNLHHSTHHHTTCLPASTSPTFCRHHGLPTCYWLATISSSRRRQWMNSKTPDLKDGVAIASGWQHNIAYVNLAAYDLVGFLLRAFLDSGPAWELPG